MGDAEVSLPLWCMLRQTEGCIPHMSPAPKGLTASLESLPHGVYILSSGDTGAPQAMVATWITQVSFDPPLLVLALENDSRFRLVCEKQGSLAIHLLTSDGLNRAKEVLTGKIVRHGHSAPFQIHPSGVPYLAGAHTVLFCRLASSMAAGDHTVYVVEAYDWISGEAGDVLTLKDTGWKYRAKKRTQGTDPHH